MASRPSRVKVGGDDVDDMEDDPSWPLALASRELRAHTHGSVPDEDAFEPLWAALGEEVDAGPVLRRHWLAGRHEGRRVVVRAAGSWQAHVVEIEPRAWLGLAASRRPGSDAPSVVGFPEDWFDGVFREQREAIALVESLARIEAPWDVLVGDSFVHVGVGVTPAEGDARVAEGLRRASQLAAAFERVRDRAPLPPWRATVMRQCEELDAIDGLRFDAGRMAARGPIGGRTVTLDVVLGRSAAGVRSGLRATVLFGQPLVVQDAPPGSTDGLRALEARVEVHEDRLEAFVDGLTVSAGRVRALIEELSMRASALVGGGPAAPYR